MKKVCAVVILYNPDSDVVERIKIFSSHTDTVYILDNSEKPVFEGNTVPGIQNAKVTFLGRNSGIAAALNLGLEMAVNQGAEWVLTMDQDSSFRPEGIASYISALDQMASDVAILTPLHETAQGKYAEGKEEVQRFTPERIVMSSGNLLRVAAFLETGPFLEKLFIDRVDNEYCLRLASKGWKIFRDNRTILVHKLGELERKVEFPAFLTKIKFALWKKSRTHDGFVHISVYSPVRRYYLFRNSLYVGNLYRKAYPDYWKLEKKARKEAIKQILFYEKKKIIKLWACIQGWWDYRNSQFITRSFP